MVFTQKKIYLMGILNITPDSFSDGGDYYNNKDKILYRIQEMIHDGADVIDVGGESTRPFSEPISLEEELSRVIPVIELIKKNFGITVSIDTYKSEVARQALDRGAEIVNDISGFTFDPQMAVVAAAQQATCIVMHIKGTPRNMQNQPLYDDILAEIKNFFLLKTRQLKKMGIQEVIVDPGFGFGKSLEDNYFILKNLSHFQDIGCPVLVGLSRKSMIGKVVKSAPKSRLSGTIALNTLAILNGAMIIRIHDVKENYQAIKIIQKYLTT